MQYQIAASPVSEKEMVIALVSGNRAEESISCHNDRIGDARRKIGKRGVMESICDTCSISRIYFKYMVEEYSYIWYGVLPLDFDLYTL